MKKVITTILILSIIPCFAFGIGITLKLPKKVGITFQSINKEYETNRPYKDILERASNIQINYIREAFSKIKPSGRYDKESHAFYSSYGEKINALAENYNEGDTIRIIGFTRPADPLQKTMDFQLIKKDENTTIIRLINSNTDISKGDFQKTNLKPSQLNNASESDKINYSPINIILQTKQPEYIDWEEKAIKNFEKIVLKHIK